MSVNYRSNIPIASQLGIALLSLYSIARQLRVALISYLLIFALNLIILKDRTFRRDE